MEGGKGQNKAAESSQEGKNRRNADWSQSANFFSNSPTNTKKRRETTKKQQEQGRRQQENNPSNELKLDVEISMENAFQQQKATNRKEGERPLQRFFDVQNLEPIKRESHKGLGFQKSESAKPLSTAFQTLDDVDDGRKFNQFEGKKSTYRDELYTTTIDQSKVTKEIQDKAHKVEKEIFTTPSEGNAHQAEDRQQKTQTDKDETERYEEMKYSGVYRQNEQQYQPNAQYQNVLHQHQQNVQYQQKQQQQQQSKGNNKFEQKKKADPAPKGAKKQPFHYSVKHCKFIIKNKNENQDTINDLLNAFLLKQQKEDSVKTLLMKWVGIEGKSLNDEINTQLYGDNFESTTSQGDETNTSIEVNLSSQIGSHLSMKSEIFKPTKPAIQGQQPQQSQIVQSGNPQQFQIQPSLISAQPFYGQQQLSAFQQMPAMPLGQQIPIGFSQMNFPTQNFYPGQPQGAGNIQGSSPIQAPQMNTQAQPFQAKKKV